MIRKNLIAATAIAAAAFSLTVASVPALAGASLYQGAPAAVESTYKHDIDHWVLSCKRVRVDTGYGWKWKKVCKKIWPKHKYGY